MSDLPDPKTAFEALRLGIGFFREAIGLARDVKSALPDDEKKKAIEESLMKADVSSRTAEAQMAQSLGYKLCQCTWPPQIMLSVGIKFVSTYGMEVEGFKCPSCGLEKY